MTTIACPCPPKADGTPRHETDTVTLQERLDFRGATTIRKALGLLYLEDPGASTAEVLAVLSEHYLLHGITGWTLVDEKGKPVPVSRAAIRTRLLTGLLDLSDLTDEADALYGEQVMLPLLKAAQKSSPPGPTDESTSPPTGSPRKPRKPSSPSSITTIPTASTAAITSSLDGDYNSSPSSRSAR